MNVFQKLANYLFGWDYVLYYNSTYSYCRRLETQENGACYITLTNTMHFILLSNGTFANHHGRWIPLTWTPERAEQMLPLMPVQRCTERRHRAA